MLNDRFRPARPPPMPLCMSSQLEAIVPAATTTVCARMRILRPPHSSASTSAPCSSSWSLVAVQSARIRRRSPNARWPSGSTVSSIESFAPNAQPMLQ